jgi:hypothetical protein
VVKLRQSPTFGENCKKYWLEKSTDWRSEIFQSYDRTSAASALLAFDPPNSRVKAGPRSRSRPCLSVSTRWKPGAPKIVMRCFQSLYRSNW